MDQHTVSAGPIDLAVTEAGRGDPVIFVHGFPELAYSWRHQLPALADAGFRAIAYDQRGYGASGKPTEVEEYRLTKLVDDLFALADAVGIETFDLVGHDWGGIVAWSAAVMRPERLSTVTSLNVPYRGWCCGFPSISFIEENLQDRFGYVLAFQPIGVAEERFAADPAGWLRRSYESVAGRPDFQTDAEFATYVEAFTAGGMFGPINAYRNIDRNAADVAALADAEITMPALMITVDRDPVLPPQLAEGMERWIPDLRREHITRCGHWTQQEQPELVNELLIDFLRS